MNFFDNLANQSKGGIYIIAEACDNHMGSTRMAKALIELAKESGADAVKFQHHIINEEMIANNLSTSNFDVSLLDFLKENALTIDQHFILKEYCDKLKITYLCTPFSYSAAREVFDLVPFFKIGSGEFLDYWYIDQIFKLGKPCIFSTGMSTHEEIINWISRYNSYLNKIALLNCLSEYPPRLEDMNLNYIKKLNEFGVAVGHSDHTQILGGSIIAAALGAKIIERHISLSDFIKGPDSSVSLDFNNFRNLIRELRVVNQMMGGHQKKVHNLEKDIRAWAHRSIVSSREILAGEVIMIDSLKTKRPANGIPSSQYESIIGKHAKINIKANTLLTWDMIL